jgi:hypothetical protein
MHFSKEKISNLTYFIDILETVNDLVVTLKLENKFTAKLV